MKVTPTVKKKTNIINCCPHTVSVYAGTVYDPAIGKSKGGKEILHIPPSGHLASVISSVEPLEPMELNGVTVPTVARNFARVTELPRNGSLYIVSSIFAQAAKALGYDVSNLLTPHGIVIDESGRTIGCTSLVRYA